MSPVSAFTIALPECKSLGTNPTSLLSSTNAFSIDFTAGDRSRRPLWATSSELAL